MQTAAESSWRQQSAPSGQFSRRKTILRPEASAQGAAETLPRCVPSPCPLWPQQLRLHTECGNLVAQGTVAHLNWLRSQSAPLVPKNSKERGLSKDPERGSAPVLGCPGQGGGTALPSHTALGSTCWGVPRTDTSFHKLTPPGKRAGVTSPPGLGISPLRHAVSAVTQTHSNP